MKQKNPLSKLLFILFWVIFSSQSLFSQSKADREKITDSYKKDLALRKGLKKGVDPLKMVLDSVKFSYLNSEKRVTEYLKNHPNQKRAYQINGKDYFIRDIRKDGSPEIITTKDLITGQVMNAPSLYQGGSLGVDISGQEMVGGIWDAGKVRTSHELFQNRALLKDGAATLSDHMCHVTGDMIGGILNTSTAAAAAKGIAYSATAWCFDWSDDATEYTQFAQDGYLLSNHSYGRGNTNEPLWSFGAYDYKAKGLDDILAKNLNYLQCWAGGNEQQSNNNRNLVPCPDKCGNKEGYDVMTGESASKNNLVIGAINPDGTMSDFSNWGPTDDGRFKPDVCATGVGLTSAYSASDNTYNKGNGTSYASPSVAGMVLLLQQYYKSIKGSYMTAAMAKGLILHTATDLGQPGPDYKFGWGSVNVQAAAQTIKTSNNNFITRNSFAKFANIVVNPTNNGTSSFDYTVTAKGGIPLMVSICWTDDAGVEQVENEGIDPTTGRLVYNFDITVKAPDGTIFYPWSGPGMSNRTANSTATGPNDVDNFLRVDIPNPTADGVYTISITKRSTSPGLSRPIGFIVTGLAVKTASINFNAPANTLNEANSSTAGCIKYTDYPMQMTIANAPTSDATVTINVDASSTAERGKHFDITTNGTFGTGSSNTLTFLGGSVAPQTYTVRVYDDAIVKPNETLKLSFTTSGGNAIVGNTADKTTITISDNDNAITTIAPATTAIGSSSGTISKESGPFSNLNADLLMDNYFLASELSAAGLTNGSQITGLTLIINQKQSKSPFPNFNISLANISGTPSTSSAFLSPTGSYTTCYSNSSYSTIAGENVFNFITPFVWDGTSNIVVRYCYDNTIDRTDNTDFDAFETQSKPLGEGVFSNVFNYGSASENLNGCTLPTSAYQRMVERPFTKFTYLKSGTPIESANSATSTENMMTSSGQYSFYSVANGKLIASISNPSLDGNCTEATIVKAGNGFGTFGSSGLLSNKIWKIAPSNNNSSIDYKITLYMTAAELNGLDPAKIKILKSSAATASEMNSSNTVEGTTIFTKNSEYTAFSSNFTGFSFFGIGSSTPLPLKLINFSGKSFNNTNLLNWQTASEFNSKNFEIERSSDGNNWVAIGSVAAKGSGGNTYSYTDNGPSATVAFYRLKMVDKDGSFTYSSVIKIVANSSVNLVSVYPNPARDIITISVGTNYLNTAAQLMNTSGQVLENILLSNNQTQVNVQALSSGVYYLRLNDGAVQKIVVSR